MGVAANLLARISAGANNDAPMAIEGFVPLALPGTNNGVFLVENAAAEVGTGIVGGERVIVLAFRGSDDRTDWINDLRNINTDYAKFAPLIAAVESYAAQHFQTVLVTGHSLGGALTQIFMMEHPAGGTVSYEAVAFASPGALIASGADERIMTYNVIDDPIVFLGENRLDIGKLASSNSLVAGAFAEKLSQTTPLTAQDVLDSVPFLTADYVNRGAITELNPGGREPLTLQTLLTEGDVDQHKVELYVALSGGAADPLNQTSAPAASAASLAAVETASRGVLREVFSSIEINADALRVDKGLSSAAYNAELVGQAQQSTIPALLVANFLEGVTPGSARLDGLTAFAQAQYDSYLQSGVVDARLGPYEALGVGFSGTTAFKDKFGAGSDASYVDAAYRAAFKTAPSGAQVTHFLEQDSYFEARYVANGVAAGDAALQARGAVFGQILGFAALASDSPYQSAAVAFLNDASDGNVAYGVPLVGVTSSADTTLAV
jgi:pimeloyl-ACP methyl ester carboxylesterase